MVGGRSNVILDPTLALIRAQLGFRIHVQAECGKNIFIQFENPPFMKFLEIAIRLFTGKQCRHYLILVSIISSGKVKGVVLVPVM